MAIEKMKHLQLAAMEADRPALLSGLQRLGCVEISEQQATPEALAFAHSGGSDLDRVKADADLVKNAISVLDTYAPIKTPLFHSGEEIDEQTLFDDSTLYSALNTADRIRTGAASVTALTNQIAKLQASQATLQPWLAAELPLNSTGTATTLVRFGTLPATADMAQVIAALDASDAAAELMEISTDRELHYVLLLAHRACADDAFAALKPFGFSNVVFKDVTGTPREASAAIDTELAACNQELEEVKQRIVEYGSERTALQRAADRLTQDLAKEETRQKFLVTDSVFFLTGWVLADKVPALEALLEKYDCALELRDPEEDEIPAVPVKLRNNWFSRPLNMVTEMYSLPAYNGVDPNPLMAPFFIFFYGFMMADMGYGILMMLASLIIMKKAKLKGPTVRHMVPLLGLCGVTTFIMGALTGGFFGNLLPQLAMLINPDTTFTEMPALFTPTGDALAVLIGSLALGVIQIFTGMGISMYKQIKRGQVMAALCNEGAWYLVFILFAVGILTGHLKPALIAIVVLLVLTQGYGKKGILGKLMGIFGSLYNNITGYFSDILSYSRLMALMLAGAVIAQVFNTLGGITGNVITFFLIAMIGNALNFALNLLSCFVHDMRLQCLEFFNRFYEDGGKPFRPLSFNTKYVDIIEE
jgi:V/A-type H+-transporting ATPase subunit I